MSGLSAMLSGSMHGVPTDVELPEPARNGLSRRASKTSLVSEQEIWLPPTTPEAAGVTSRAFAYAASDSPAPPPSARRDSFASSTGRVSRSGSIQSGYVQVDPEVPSSAYFPRGRNVPEESVPQSARAREKQREAQPQLVRPRLPSDVTGRRVDERPPAPSPAWSQFMSDGQYPFTQAVSGVEYPSPTERKGIPIKKQGASRASSRHRGSPESLRQPRAASKNSWGYDSSPGSAGLLGPQSLQSSSATGAGRPIAPKRSFTGDEDVRLPQTSPMTRVWHGPKGRRDSTGSYSIRSQRSRPDLFTRPDGFPLSPLPSDESAHGTDEFDDIDWDEAEYGIDNLERIENRLHLDEKVRDLNMREEDIRRKLDAVEQKAADAERKMADAVRRDSEARKRDEEARQRDQEARDRMEDVRKLEAAARKLEEAVRQRERELRGKEEEVRQREVKIRAREDEVLRKEDEMRMRIREVQKKGDEVARREQAVQRKEEEVAVKEEGLRARKEALDTQEAALKEREEAAQQREATLNVLEVDLSQKEAEIARQESSIQHHDEELKTKEFMLRELGEQLQAREAVLHEQAQRDRTELDESLRAQAERQREADELRRQTEEVQRAERLQAEQRALREAQEAQEAQRLAEERRLKEEERKRREDDRRRQAQQREEAKRQEEQAREENRRREAAQRQAVEADMRRRAGAARRESTEQVHGTQNGGLVDGEPVFDAENVSPEFIREQEALLKQYERNRNDSMSSDGSPRSTTFVSASQSAPRNIPGRASSSTGATAADRSSTASSSSYQSSAGFSFSGQSSASTYTQASTHSQASTATPSSTPTPNAKQARGGWKAAGATPVSSATAQSQFAAASSLPPPTPQEEEEWKRRQREHARQQAEKFQRMQEQAEQERYSRSTKQLSREEVVKVFEEHERRWARLSNLDVFTWYSFPWPVLQRVSNPEELTVQAIRAYVLSPHHPNERNKSAKDVIKDYIKRWHPDRFETKFLPKVREDDREKVKEGAGIVARNLNELLTRQSSLPDFAT